MSDSHAGDLPPLRVLVVENNEDTLKYLRLYLMQMGHTVTSARTLMLGAGLIQKEHPDVVISDIGLPDGSGWDLLKLADSPERIYAIAMSGFGMNTDRARSHAAGYREHILKPFSPDQLDAFLETASAELAEARAQP